MITVVASAWLGSAVEGSGSGNIGSGKTPKKQKKLLDEAIDLMCTEGSIRVTTHSINMTECMNSF